MTAGRKQIASGDREWRSAFIALAVFAFTVTLALELLYAHFGELDRYDGLFDADAASYRQWAVHNLRHPAVSTLFAPAAALAKAAQAFHFAARADVERALALLVSPLAQAALAVGLAGIARRIGATRAGAVPFAMLGVVAAGSVTIGSITETYGVTAALIVAAVLLGTCRWRSGAALRWMGLGAVAGAVTTTNLVVLPVLLWLSLVRIDRRPWRDAARTVTACALGMFVGVALLAGVAVARAGVATYSVRPMGDEPDPDLFAPRRSSLPLELPVTIANSVVMAISPQEASCVEFWESGYTAALGGTPAPYARFPSGTLPARGERRANRCVTTAGIDLTTGFVAAWTGVMFVAMAFGIRSLWTMSHAGAGGVGVDEARFVVAAAGIVCIATVAALWIRHGIDFFLVSPLFVFPATLALAGPHLRGSARWHTVALWALVGLTALRSANLVSQIIGR